MGDRGWGSSMTEYATTGRYAGEQHGRSLTLITLGGSAPQARQIPIDRTVHPDDRMEAILAPYRSPPQDASR
jgi:hypothetical protein